jgi:hypothetical protein
MKYSCLILIVILNLVLFSCKKHVITPVSQLSLLPPATQTGANTFGCLAQGIAFTPKKGPSVPGGIDLQCSYSSYGFDINAAADPGNGWLTQIIIVTNSLTISQGNSYSLKDIAPSNAYALDVQSYDNGISGMTYETRKPSSGMLTITKLDPVNHIVSGTFYFNAIDDFADTIKITDGRFDLLYKP